MKGKNLLFAIALVVGIAAVATTAVAAPLPNGTLLGITQGAGSATGITCATGSCFGLELSPGMVSWTDFGPGTDGGFVVGKSQQSGGQEIGPSSTPGELTSAWSFFGNYGTFFTSPGGATNVFDSASCVGTGCIGKTELMVFNAAWNGGVFTLGSADGVTGYQINPVTGGAWSMNYASVVPSGAFAGLKFSAIMRGKVNQATIDLCADAATRCNDNNACTIDSCDTATGNCIHMPVGGTCGLPGTPLPNGTLLGIAQGAGSAMGIPCATGSCFGMETSPGMVSWTDFGPGTDGGFVVGKSQLSGGQEIGPSGANSTPGELTAAWSFFGNYGTFFTSPGGATNVFDSASCTGTACIGKTALKVFNAAWNGLSVPLGNASGTTLYQINPVTGGAWSMNFSSVVPAGDPSGFGNVKFSAIMRGKVNQATIDLCADAAARCNDNNACTIDSCDTATGNCIHTPVGGTCGLPGTPLPAGTKLGITQGSGSATGVPCATGSCFGLETSPGMVSWTDFGPGTDGGFVVGKSQQSGGQEIGPSSANSTSGELTAAWSFFANYGTFFTSPGGATNVYNTASCAGTDCIGKTALKVFNAAWNGGVFSLGSEDGCTLYQINPVSGGAWSMNYASVVPSGAFAGVKFSAIMRGNVNQATINRCANAATRCNDHNACTTDSCNPSNGKCEHIRIPKCRK